MSKRAVLYARVSTDEQAEHGYSLPTQLEACRKYAEQHGFTIAAELQDDCSGAIRMSDRPDGARLFAILDRKEAGAIIVYTADRLSRKLAHSLIMREQWQRAGVELHCVDRGKAEDTSESRLMQNVEAVIAEYEREKIRERTQRGKEAKARNNGSPVFGGNVSYGYRIEGQKRLACFVIYEPEAHIVRLIFKWYICGADDGQPMPLRIIAERLDSMGVPPPRGGQNWIPTTIRRILGNEIYAGRTYYCKTREDAQGRELMRPRANWIAIDVPQLAIIDRDTFEAAQTRVERNKELAKRNRKHDYLLSSFFRCGLCKGAMAGRTGGGHTDSKYRYYCGSNHRKGDALCANTKTSLNAPMVDDMVWGWLTNLLKDDAKLDKGIDEMNARRADELGPKRRELETTNTLIDKAERKIKRLTGLAGDADDEEIAAEYDAQAKAEGRAKAKLVAERDKLLAELSQGEVTEADRQTIKAIAAQIRRKLDNKPSYEQKRQLLDLLDARVVLQTENDKRWLSVNCGLSTETKTIELPTPTRPTRRRDRT